MGSVIAFMSGFTVESQIDVNSTELHVRRNVFIQFSRKVIQTVAN